MAKQDEWRPFEAQPKPSLPVSPRRGHTTKDCRTLWNHLEQLVKEGRLQQFLYRPNGQEDQSRTEAQGNAPPRPLLGTINVIFAAPGKTDSHPTRVMSVARLLAEDSNFEPKRARLEIPFAEFLRRRQNWNHTTT